MATKFKDPLDDDKPFEFPTALLHQISECSPSGFLLFFVDSFGAPQVRANFTHPIAEMGLRSFVTKFMNEVGKAEDASIAETLHQDNDEEDD